MSTSDCFQNLIARIQPTPTELLAKRRHGAEIQSCLKAAFDLHSLRSIGSHSRGSAISGYSDLDLLAVFGRKSATRAGALVSSETVLKWVRDALGRRFQSTESTRDGQAIVVKFRDGNVDVVPAIFNGMLAGSENNRPTFLIPKSGGNWMLTAPDLHDQFIKKAHVSSGHKFTACIQLLKFWRECRAQRTPLSSFHLELLFADYHTFSRIGTYQECMHAAFKALHDRRCRALRDPLGVSGLVAAASSDAKADVASVHVFTAVDKAERAIIAEQSGKNGAAREYWNMVFNGRFPTA
jgi:hypothetical protein